MYQKTIYFLSFYWKFSFLKIVTKHNNNNTDKGRGLRNSRVMWHALWAKMNYAVCIYPNMVIKEVPSTQLI